MTERRYRDLGERWRKGIAAKGLTTAEVARRLGVIHGRQVTRQSIDQVVQGVSPGHVHIEHVAQMLSCTVEWLTTGTGEAPSWATERFAREAGETYEAPPAWAAQLLAEVQALRAEVAALRTPRVGAADEVDQIMDPDEHPRTEAPTYPRQASVPDGTPHGR